MSSNVSEGVVQVGKLLVHISENGHSFEVDCDEYTLVEAVHQSLESVSGININDQLLLCLDMKLELQRPLSAYGLPSDDREVYLFNKARMRSNSPPPEPEQIDFTEIPDPPLPSSSCDPHPLDDATDPALKALPSYERQFRYHYQCGDAIYSRTQMKVEICERLMRELKVQEKALEIARGNLDHFYRMILQNFMDFMKCYSQQHRSHSNLLANFGRDIEKLRFCKLLPALQTANRKCLLDFVKEDSLRKLVEDCSSSHRQFENKVSEFKQEFGELKRNAEHLFASKASFLVRDLETSIKDHQQYIIDQKSIMQALSKDVHTVKKLVDESVTSQLSSSLRPHDAVSALGPMYDVHEKSYIGKMQTCDSSISNLLDFCKDKKNEMNIFVHNYMQKIAYIQYSIKDVRYKFSVFTEALKRQNNQFEHLKVVRGIGSAYRACLAEVVRRKASMKLYMGMAGQVAERLATKREAEVRRRVEFLKAHSPYIPRDILAAMGLYDNPTQCDVNMTPFDTNLIDIDISDVDRYAPEYLVGLSLKHGTLKGSSSMSSEASQSAVVDDSGADHSGKYDLDELLEGSDLVDIAGTSKMEVENAKLKAELASAIALICSFCPEFEYESLEDSKVDTLLKNAAQKTAEALHLKDEYGKRLQSLLKVKQLQCESYEKRIQELELQGNKQSVNKDTSNSTEKIEDSKSEISGDGESHMPHASSESMDGVSCGPSSLHVKLAVLSKEGKAREGLDDSMSDSSGMLNPLLDSSMLEQNRDECHLGDKDGRDTRLDDEDLALATSSMTVSMSHPLIDHTAPEPSQTSRTTTDLILEWRNELAKKSSELTGCESKIKDLLEEVAKLARELDISRKLLDESQMNCAHLENCLHEARGEAQTHQCTADRRASEYSALRSSAVKSRALFERLRNCVSSAGVTGFPESLRALAQSLSNLNNINEDDGTAEIRDCILVLAEKVVVLSRQNVDFHDRYMKAEASNEQLKKELEEKKELINTLYMRQKLEKQANKEKISFGRLEVHEIAAFVLNSDGNYEAINRNCYYYLSSQSVALFADHLPNRPTYIIGQIVHIERQTVRSLSPSSSAGLGISDPKTTCGHPVGSEYFIVTVAMLPDTPTIHSPPTTTS